LAAPRGSRQLANERVEVGRKAPFCNAPHRWCSATGPPCYMHLSATRNMHDATRAVQ